MEVHVWGVHVAHMWVDDGCTGRHTCMCVYVCVHLQRTECQFPQLCCGFWHRVSCQPGCLQTPYVAGDDLKVSILSPLPRKCLDHWHALPYLVYVVLGSNPGLWTCFLNMLPTERHPYSNGGSGPTVVLQGLCQEKTQKVCMDHRWRMIAWRGWSSPSLARLVPWW